MQWLQSHYFCSFGLHLDQEQKQGVSKLAVLFLVVKDWNTGIGKFHCVLVAFFFLFLIDVSMMVINLNICVQKLTCHEDYRNSLILSLSVTFVRLPCWRRCQFILCAGMSTYCCLAVITRPWNLFEMDFTVLVFHCCYYLFLTLSNSGWEQRFMVKGKAT